MKRISLRLTVLMAAILMTLTMAAKTQEWGGRVTANPARRTFLTDLVWKFNEARSKYRGSGAGEKQKACMWCHSLFFAIGCNKNTFSATKR